MNLGQDVEIDDVYICSKDGQRRMSSLHMFFTYILSKDAQI
jgi:hypothetical protein